MRFRPGSSLVLLIPSGLALGYLSLISSGDLIMTHQARVRVVSAQPAGGRGLIRWICTNNPFYVLSAGLFLAGLWISFGAQSEEVQTWALMSGLAGYTLLLAVTACLLVRFGNVWDDVRTVLLLVVLLFLATSVTFDEVLVFNPVRGFVCYLAGLLFALVVSEGLLRGIRLALPPLFRLPYYLILSLFFLYPLALRPLLADGPRSEMLIWGLFGFSPLAGLMFLSLLPAIRRGPDYVRDNGSPWRWPLYPWVLFGLLAFAVPARAFLLCWSMQLLELSDMRHVLFGPFFLLPFGLAIAVLLMEIGLVSRRRSVLWTAMSVPVLLLALLVLGHRDDPIYLGFLRMFADRVGDPLIVTMLASACFYAYTAVRRVPSSVEALTAALTALAVVGPYTLNGHELVSPRVLPLLAAAGLQLALGAWRRGPWRYLCGTAFTAAAVLALADGPEKTMLAGFLAFHLLLFSALIVGATFEGALAAVLCVLAPVVAGLAYFVVLFARSAPATNVPSIVPAVYPLIMATILLLYGLLLRQRTSLTVAGLILTGWAAVFGWRLYAWLRQVVVGIDHILLSLALFAVALLVSLGKAGVLWRCLPARWRPLSRARLEAALDAGQWPDGAAVPPEAVQPEVNQVREEP